MSKHSLRITGARENNLQDISLELEHDCYTAVTGLSGSGKSSLAFSTVYAEGQRRYIETFSPYTRQFFDKVKKPDVLSLEHVRPALAIQQRTRVTSSRSTVGSMTNLFDLLKILWANLAVPHSPHSGAELIRWTPEMVLEDLQKSAQEYNSQTVLICSRIPLSKAPKLAKQEIDRLEILGYSRYYKSDTNEILRFEDSKPDPKAMRSLFVVLDRVRCEKLNTESAQESIEHAFALSRDNCTLVFSPTEDFAKVQTYPAGYTSSNPDDPPLEFEVPAPRPALFDPNSPLGACTECKGFGKTLTIDILKVVPLPNLSLEEGALHPWNGPKTKTHKRSLLRFCKEEKIATDVAWHKLPPDAQEAILHTRSRSYRGIFPFFESLERKLYKMHVRVFLAKYRSQVNCTVCNGGRLNPAALLFRLGELDLGQVMDTPIEELLTWANTIEGARSKDFAESRDLTEVFERLKTRLTTLHQLGLPYLTLGRQSRTLSGGETQRVNLTGALGSDLISTHFVLDEPSVGLHPRDTDQLISALQELCSRGNSLLVVEHDQDCLEAADNILELGPKAGADGGKVTFHGSTSKWKGLISQFDIVQPRTIPKKHSSYLEVHHAKERNLKDISVRLPVGYFTTITGVSGSGKSSLVSQVILEAHRDFAAGIERHEHNLVNGFEYFEQVLLVDQSGLAKSPRANIATYSGIWDQIRKDLASTDEAQARALTKSSFSFNVDGGRCPTCKGAGHIREDMQFLSDVYVMCEDCLGKRFQAVPLEVTFHGRNAHEWLETTVDECSTLLHSVPKVRDAAETLSRLGLGHLRLGHSLSDLSGGEAQRLKLVPFIQKSQKGNSLLLFDEPTTGLHLDDVRRLLGVLQDLTLLGHTVVCIEHNQELILSSDWIIDLGPEGGAKGGELLLEGPPKTFLSENNKKISYTANYLQGYFNQNRTDRGKKKKFTSKKKAAHNGPQPLALRGAREHNLKNVSLTLPHNKVIALTGVSGSGKSTIAKDIIYSEGQRRYLDCLSPYARQFIRELEKPDIDEISNLRPTICVYQHTFQPGKLSTLGTMSEVYSFLRLLYAKLGEQYCPDHLEERVSALSAKEIAQHIQALGNEEVRLLAPIIKGRKGLHKTVFQRAIQSEMNEVRVDGSFGSPSDYLEGLERAKTHTIDYVWGKVVPSRVPLELLQEGIEEIFALGGGVVIVHTKDAETLFSRERACPVCSRGVYRPDPEDLSFHSKRGRCETCSGEGVTKDGSTCPACDGTRLKPFGRSVRVGGLEIGVLTRFTAEEAQQHFTELSWSDNEEHVAQPVLREITSRLSTLCELGLDYLPLNRSCHAMSQGELQRLRLAAALGTPLSGAMYIFDEPSAGLHPQDNHRILSKFQQLRDARNTVMLIEHDEESIESADYVVEVGPGAGKFGGTITFEGPQSNFSGVHAGKTTTKKKSIHKSAEKLSLTSGTRNNIKDLSVDIPLHQLVTFAGVSGAGKSSLLHGIILESILGKDYDNLREWNSRFGNVTSTCDIDRVLMVDQQPIGKNSRSTPASYLKVWDEIRKLYAQTVEARSHGWTASYFSYNSGDGKCSECKGLGRIKLEMSFLSEAFVVCEYCGGKRFTDEALSIDYLGKNVFEVLSMTFEEAKDHFANHKKIHRIFHHACELGLGYLQLGQSSVTLSGGESQRIKLVSELSRAPRGHTLYILDEPTVGLHRKDVSLLINVLQSLVAQGNSVFLIEHDRDMLLASDHIIELGPGPGENGGKIIHRGAPNTLQKKKTPWGQILSS